MRVPPCSADASYAPLVIDDPSSAIRRFHATTELERDGDPEARALARLRCSGSAQPSVAAFVDLRRRLAGVRDPDLIVVDLRKESHGFVNGVAVSWYAETNWGTAGLSDDDAVALERLRLALLASAPTVRIGNALDVKRGRPLTLSEWHPHTVQREADAFGLGDGHHVRLPVVDHCGPSDPVIDRFVDLIRGRSPTSHLHVHCRGGKGRTATVLAMLDMLHHAADVPLDAILARQARLCDYDLTKPADPESRKAPFLRARLALIQQFYGYAQTRPLDHEARWSDWIANQPAARPPG